MLEYEENVHAFVEKYLGLDFSERYVDGAIEYNDSIIHYETIRRRQFNKIIKIYKSEIMENGDRRILDYGSGKGYILFLLKKTALFDVVDGVEILPELCEIAKTNMRAKKINDVHIFNEDARKFEKIDDYNTFFMFNPFPKEAIIEVVDRLQESLDRNDRKICIIYINNVHEEQLLKRISGLRIRQEVIDLPRFGCKSTIYTNY